MFWPADDQDKDGFKLENGVGPTFSSFAVVTAQKIGTVVLSILVDPFVLQSLLIFL